MWSIACLMCLMSLMIKNFNKGEEPPKVPLENANSGLKILLSQHKSSMAYMLMLCFPGAIVAYFLITILPNILTEVLHDGSQNIPAITVVGILVFVSMFYVSAHLTKYINIKKVIASGMILMVLTPLPLYYLYKIDSDYLIVFFVGMSAVFGLAYGIILSLFAESFPKEIRYTGFALTYNIGFGIYGGLLPFVCFYLAKNISDYAAVSMICISAIVGLIALYKFEPAKTKEFTSRID